MPFYAGFDTLEYPAAAMDWLKSNTNLVWCGYYLAPAPNRPLSTWMGTFAAITGKWGVVPIYVGQQDLRAALAKSLSSKLTALQGTLDGKAACDLVAAEGFPAGSFVYLDWEYGALDGAGSAAYIKAWTYAVAKDGRARPGIYCSYRVAHAITAVIDSIKPTPITRFFCVQVSTGDRHPFTGNIASLPEIDPAGCGFAGAEVWQREQQAIVMLPHGAPVASLLMDFSTSALANPSAPLVASLGTAGLPTNLSAALPPRTRAPQPVTKAGRASTRAKGQSRAKSETNKRRVSTAASGAKRDGAAKGGRRDARRRARRK
jgi:Domain of unknown function (DUF1906)